jgi:DMSO/TMAO reductase YedYZ molybdopterin-dependent catalytic subunit
VIAQEPAAGKAMETFTGPGTNPHWNSVGPYVTEPQKVPLLLLTDRPVQLETPRHYFHTVFTSNEAFYVRWHLEGIPNSVDLQNWKLHIEGNVNQPFSLSLPDLMKKFKPVSVAAVNQCSGNSRANQRPSSFRWIRTTRLRRIPCLPRIRPRGGPSFDKPNRLRVENGHRSAI